MQKNSTSESGVFRPRLLVALSLCCLGVVLAMFSFAAPMPTSGKLTSANIGSANALTYADSVGSALNLTFFAGSGTCAVPMSCSTYTLTIDPSVGTASAGYDPTKYNIFIELSWQ